ncbi:MAG: LEA type 2 family protein [Treponemataceae bacterium]|nr:LEA type 2 family protein [Treponemataceae bacterium]
MQSKIIRSVKYRWLPIALLIVSFPLWAQLPKPSAELKRCELQSMTLRDVTFLFELAVKNPYPVGLSFSGMSLDFSVEGAKVFSTQSQGGFSVPANQEKVNTFTVTLTYEAIMKLVKEYTTKEWLTTVIDGVLLIPLPKIPGLPPDISFTYKLEKKIPAIKPEVRLLDFSVDPPSATQVSQALIQAGKKADPGKARQVFTDILSGKKPETPVIDPAELDLPLSVSFTLEIRNDAKASLVPQKMGYELFINGEPLVLGEAPTVINEGSRTLIKVTNTFSSKRLSQGIRSIFAERKGTFEIRGNATIKLPDEIRREPVPLVFREGGSFSLK